MYTKIIPNAKSDTLIPIIERKVIPDRHSLCIVTAGEDIMRLMYQTSNI